MNSKGFTLVELIVSIAILGLITAISIPTLNVVQSSMEQKQFVSYGDSLINAAKIYTDSYSEDMFATDNVFQLSYSELKKKGLVKDIGISDTTCNDENTYIVVVKNGNSYIYCLTLTCKSSSGDEVYNSNNTELGTKTGYCNKIDQNTVKLDCNNGDNIITSKVVKGSKYYLDYNKCKKNGYGVKEYKVTDDSGTLIKKISSSENIIVNQNLNIKATYQSLVYPEVKVNVYKRGSDGNKTGPILKTYLSDGEDSITIKANDYPNNVNGWLNKENYPYGVYYEIISTDKKGIQQVQQAWNDSGLTEKYEKISNYGSKIENPPSVTSMYLSAEGKRYSTYTVKNVNGKDVVVKIYANIDRTVSSEIKDVVGKKGTSYAITEKAYNLFVYKDSKGLEDLENKIGTKYVDTSINGPTVYLNIQDDLSNIDYDKEEFTCVSSTNDYLSNTYTWKTKNNYTIPISLNFKEANEEPSFYTKVTCTANIYDKAGNKQSNTKEFYIGNGWVSPTNNELVLWWNPNTNNYKKNLHEFKEWIYFLGGEIFGKDSSKTNSENGKVDYKNGCLDGIKWLNEAKYCFTDTNDDANDKDYYNKYFSKELVRNKLMTRGWVSINGDWYFAYVSCKFYKKDNHISGGQIVTNKWLFDESDNQWGPVDAATIEGISEYTHRESDDATCITFKPNSETETQFWCGFYYYVGDDGKMLHDTWSKIDNNWFYFNSNGRMKVGWLNWNNNWYYFKASGVMISNQWLDLDGKWYYFKESGAMASNQWLNIEGKKYQFNGNGVCTNC